MTTTPWTKARKSGGNGGSCVEMRRHGTMIEVRDTKANGSGPVLRLTSAEIGAWLDGARNGRFDHLLRNSGSNVGHYLGMRRHGTVIEVRDAKANGAGPVLCFTEAEIDAWLDGVRNGEFDHLLA